MKLTTYAMVSVLLLNTLAAVAMPVKSISNPTEDGGSALLSLSLHWELQGNEMQPRAAHQASFTITNTGSVPLEPGWTLYFNAIYVNASAQSLTPGATLQHLSGDFFRFATDPSAGSLLPGDSVRLDYRSGGFLMKNKQVPEGAYFVPAGEVHAVQFASFTHSRLEVEDQLSMFAGTSRPVPGPEYLFSLGDGLELLTYQELAPVVPTPWHWQYTQGRANLAAGLHIIAEPALQSEIQIFKQAVLGVTADVFGGTFRVETGETLSGSPPETPAVSQSESPSGTVGLLPVRIKLTNLSDTHPEGYILNITSDAIALEASRSEGIFYGLQTLLSMISSQVASLSYPLSQPRESMLTLPNLSITDAPRFVYRGLFLDISRNYQQPADIKRLIDVMALYKFNVLQLHLANDEAWRIEIPGLPELTEFGSRRGHGTDETKHLWPYYGSGPDPDNSPHGSGYLSRQQFIEILQYAHDRHIEVIPEIVAPGHMKAAIYAMEYRYRRLMERGEADAAVEFLLKHPQDTSDYLSIQRYRRNTMDICMESSYKFYAHVTDALLDMYSEAEVPIRTFHTGGDEVPRGVWTGSPACAELIATEPALSDTQDLHNWFYRRLGSMLQERGLQLAGWEEVGQVRVREGERYVHRPNQELLGKGFRLHAWNAVVGWPGTDMAYQLANAGYEVVMSNSSNVYFDLAYDMHPDEPGLHWSGFVNLRSSWQMTPFNHFISNDADMQGIPVDAEALAASHERLTEAGKNRIVGLQGQLWSETVRGPDMMFYYLLPKMLGLAERAWSPDPEWSGKSDETLRRSEMLRDWNRFSNRVGQYELPMLEVLHGGYNTRLPRPGARVTDAYLYANVETPGLQIRYTTDGNEPHPGSALYTGPIPVADLFAEAVQPENTGQVSPQVQLPNVNRNQTLQVRLKTFTPAGHSGGTTRIYIVN
jgi:hexosaminidase